MTDREPIEDKILAEQTHVRKIEILKKEKGGVKKDLGIINWVFR